MSFCQSTEAPPYKEINRYLVEGLECKELLFEKNDLIKKQSELINLQHDAAYDLKAQTAAMSENYQIATDRNIILKAELLLMDVKLKTATSEANRLKNGRNTWRNASILVLAILAGTIILLR